MTASTLPIHIIGSSDESQRICGTNVQPWTVEAPVGQKISIRLIEFVASESGKIVEQNRQSCRGYGVIVEKGSKRNVSICGDGVHRENELHLSDGNALDIIFNRQEEKKHNAEVTTFMLKLEGRTS